MELIQGAAPGITAPPAAMGLFKFQHSSRSRAGTNLDAPYEATSPQTAPPSTQAWKSTLSTMSVDRVSAGMRRTQPQEWASPVTTRSKSPRRSKSPVSAARRLQFEREQVKGEGDSGRHDSDPLASLPDAPTQQPIPFCSAWPSCKRANGTWGLRATAPRRSSAPRARRWPSRGRPRPSSCSRPRIERAR